MKRLTRRALVVGAGVLICGPAAVMAMPVPSVAPGPVNYAVHLDKGVLDDVALSIHSVTLVDCVPSSSWFDDLRAVMGVVVGNVVGFETAQAGHTSGGVDSAAIDGQWTVTGDGDVVDLGAAVVDQPAYCEVHLAFADRAPGTTKNTGPTVVGVDAGGAAFETDASWGVNIALTDADGTPVTVHPGDPLDVEVTLAVGDVPQSEAATDPTDILRAIVAHSSATVSTV